MPAHKEDICLVGFGAIGTLYGFALERSRQVRLTVVCRSNYDIITGHGLDIESDRLGNHKGWKPYRVVRTVEEAADRNYSYIVCAVKCLPDVNPTPSILYPLLKRLHAWPSTAIVLLQNGIGITDNLQNTLDDLGVVNPILSGCAWVDATVVDGGRRLTQHGNEKLVLGCHPSITPGFHFAGAAESLGYFCALLKRGGVNYDSVPNIEVARWRKVLWNASFSTVCTLRRATVGEVLATPESREYLKSIIVEVLSVAHKILKFHVDLLPYSLADTIISNENPASVFKPSMLVDLEAGRPMEVEVIVGAIVKKARDVGVEVPKLEEIYASLMELQKGLVSGVQK